MWININIEMEFKGIKKAMLKSVYNTLYDLWIIKIIK